MYDEYLWCEQGKCRMTSGFSCFQTEN